MARQRLSSRPPNARFLSDLTPVKSVCLELSDHSFVDTSAIQFFGIKDSRDPQPQAARLAEQFIAQNRGLFHLMEVSVSRDYDGRDVRLRMESGSVVGALPLLSPYSAKPDYGLLVQPRFPWPGIGPMLAEMGWRVAPAALRLPLLKRSERRVPPWVLSFMVLARIQSLLDRLERRFEFTEQDRSAPKGAVRWQQYATRRIPYGGFLSVPCVYPELRDDRHLKGAVRFTLERQLQSLETQRQHGSFVHRMILLAEMLLQRVRAVPACRPSPREIDSWLRSPLRSSALIDGIQAIEWTAEERGLAGLSDLEGIPWTMRMDAFFEAWVETVLRSAAIHTGGRLKTGRLRETVAPLAWQPPYLGSQKSLVPDFLLEIDGCTFIFDAKYKRHWEEFQHGRWAEKNEDLREQHRQDLLQVLSYANLATTPRVVCCLAYPCSLETWESLRARNRLCHKAEVAARSRQVQAWLTGIPMCSDVERVAAPLVVEIRRAASVAQ